MGSSNIREYIDNHKQIIEELDDIRDCDLSLTDEDKESLDKTISILKRRVDRMEGRQDV